MHSVGIVIPTYKARNYLPRILPKLRQYYPEIPILVVDSESKDGSAEYAQNCGAFVEVIRQSDFNHGLTREYARKKINTDIVVMMTQDAVPVNEDLIDRLVSPLIEGKAAVSYARQLPHDGADFFEAFPRDFNYPPESHIRSQEDIRIYGCLTYFCSDTCAAWLNSALDEIGGFDPVLLGEDTVAVAKLLKRGHKIAYVADAMVRHSHRYTLAQEMKRYFDAGYERKRLQSLLLSEVNDEKRGRAYAHEMFRRLAKEKPYFIPYGLMHLAAKYMGYFLGKHSRWVPKLLWPSLSSQPYYWSSVIAKKNTGTGSQLD